MAQKFCDWFEGKIYDKLKFIQSTSKAKMYRYPDKKGAGKGYANKQPADFFIVLNGMHIDLECKTSEKHTDFLRCYKGLVKDHQMTSARKTHRAGARYLFLFCSSENRKIEIWDSQVLIEAYSIPRKIPNAKPLAIVEFDCATHDFITEITKQLY